MGRKVINDIPSMLRHGARLTVQCTRCGNTAKFDPTDLQPYRKGWSTGPVDDLVRRMRCRCGHRDVKARIEIIGD